MALGNVEQLVRNRLPFLLSDTPTDNLIESYKIESYYFLQPNTGFSDADVEDDTKYGGVLRMLVADLVAYNLLSQKILANVGGVAGGTVTAGRRVKKGKADVVEAEFDYGKSSDGTFLGGTGSELLEQIKSSLCAKAYQLSYSLPMCDCGVDATYFMAFNSCGDD